MAAIFLCTVATVLAPHFADTRGCLIALPRKHFLGLQLYLVLIAAGGIGHIQIRVAVQEENPIGETCPSRSGMLDKCTDGQLGIAEISGQRREGMPHVCGVTSADNLPSSTIFFDIFLKPDMITSVLPRVAGNTKSQPP
jgi:hypothetical protein